MRNKFSALRFHDKIFLAYGFVFLLMFGVMFGITNVLTRLAFKRQMEAYVEELDARISNQYSSFLREIKKDVETKSKEPSVRNAILRGETNGKHLGETDFDIIEYGTAYGRILFSTELAGTDRALASNSASVKKKQAPEHAIPSVTTDNPRTNIRFRKVTQGGNGESRIVVEVTEAGDWGFFTGGYFFDNWLETEPIIQSDEHPIFLVKKNNRMDDWIQLNYAASRNGPAFREKFLAEPRAPDKRKMTVRDSTKPDAYPERPLPREISLQATGNTPEQTGTRVLTPFQIEPFSSPYVDTGQDVEVELIVGYSHQRQSKWQQQLTTILLLSGVGGLALVYLISYVLSRRITRPIAILREGVSQIASGNLNHRVNVHSKSEIGQLADGFNQMARELNHNLEERMTAERAETWRDVAQQVAHEIKNPLFPIRLSVENLQQAKAYPEIFENIFHECTETVIEEVDRIGTLIDEFQQFARMPTPKRKPVDLNEIVTSVLMLYKNAGRNMLPGPLTTQPLIETETDIKIESHLNPLPKLLLDKEQIAQVLGNLLKNSMEAMPNGGTLQVKTYVSDNHTSKNKESDGTRGASGDLHAISDTQTDTLNILAKGAEAFTGEYEKSTCESLEKEHNVLLEVQDTGYGMSTATLKSLFTPYFTTKSNGTGLGMAIVQRIVGAHGGNIHVESDEERGTIVQISFVASEPSTERMGN